MDKKEQAAIYCRVSTEDQGDKGTSLQTQEEHCRRYADEHGYSVSEDLIFRETYTGADLHYRPQLTLLREVIRQKHVDVVIVLNVDRLSRNQAHIFILTDEIERAGIRFEFVLEKFENTAVGKFTLSAKVFAAELELEKIRFRTMDGKLAKVRGGKPLGVGLSLYGYCWADSAKTRFEVDPTTGPVVARIFSETLAGKTLGQIIDLFAAEGIPPPRYNQIAWHHSTLSRILRNPAYMGRAVNWRWQTFKKSNGRRERVMRPQDQWIKLPDGTIPPVVDETTWQAAQQLMDRHRERAGRKAIHKDSHLLRGGFIYCGYCGRPMETGWDGRYNKPKYICHSKKDKYGSCQESASINAAIIDPIVWDLVKRILLQPDLIVNELAKLRQNDPTTNDLEAIERGLTAASRKQSRLIDALADVDDDTAEAIKLKLSGLSATKRQLQEERERLLTRRAKWELAQNHLDKLQAWCSRVAAKLNELDFSDKQLALRALGVKVRLWRVGHDPRYDITTNLPLENMELAPTL